MNVIKFKDNHQLSQYVIDNYFLKDSQNIIIPSGSTPQHLYKQLIELDVHKDKYYFGLDEWKGISKEKKGSCFEMLQTDFISKLPKNINFEYFNGLNEFTVEKQRFEEMLNGVQIDLAILGVGLNGHIGLNEKTIITDEMIIETKLDEVTKNVANQKYFKGDTKITNGYTFSLNYILQAKTVLIILNTSNKKEIWNIIQNSSDKNIPAVYLKKFDNVKYLVLEELCE